MIPLLISAIVFGLSAGFSPGPLIALVIAHTIKYNHREGIKIAITPLITDAPIIIFSFVVLKQVSNSDIIIGILSIIGGIYLLYLAYESYNVKPADLMVKANVNPQSIKKGVLANLFSPAPYLFWFSIGGISLTNAYDINLLTAILFLFFFYSCLVGSKILLAYLIGKSKRFVQGKGYIYTMRFLGAVLAIFAILFFKQGISLLN